VSVEDSVLETRNEPETEEVAVDVLVIRLVRVEVELVVGEPVFLIV